MASSLAAAVGQLSSCLRVAGTACERELRFVSGLRLPTARCQMSNSSLRRHQFDCAPAYNSSWGLRRAAAASEEIENLDFSEDILEDSKFARINDDDPCFGPPAMLLVGFSTEDVFKVHNLLKEMDGQFMKVLLVTEPMFDGTLGMALSADQPDMAKVKPAEGCARMCFLSGLSGEEILLMIQAFEEAGLKKPIFAGHVPNNTAKNLEEVIDEILGDHKRLSGEREPLEA